MKKALCLLVLALLMFAAGPSYALGPFGAPEPTAQPGKFAFGVGYFYYDSSWDADVLNVVESIVNQSGFVDGSVGVSNPKIQQNAFYLQGSYSFVKDWEVYGRLGGADLKAKISAGITGEDAESLDVRGSDGYKLFGTVGVKGLFYNSPSFAMGPFMQASFYSSYDDSFDMGDGDRISVKIQNPWDFSVGIAGQGKIGPVTIYGGPFFYYATTKAQFIARGFDVYNVERATIKLEEKNNIGAFLGFKVPITKQISFDMEGQLRSNYLFGASISYAF
jgi:hypothetical protein